MPHIEAGLRMAPPMSVPSAAAKNPAARPTPRSSSALGSVWSGATIASVSVTKVTNWLQPIFICRSMAMKGSSAKEVHLGATFDDEGRQITPPRSVGYDTLVIAIGSVTSDFGTPGVAEHAVPLAGGRVSAMIASAEGGHEAPHRTPSRRDTCR
jgi:hypothetical protein